MAGTGFGWNWLTRLLSRPRPYAAKICWLTSNRSFRIYEKTTVVNLSETVITDADLVNLEKLNGLERLNLSETPITDAGLAHLKRLMGLKALDLSRTKISGPGLENLSDLTNLEYLYLSGTPMNDGDLHHLNRMRKLRHLDVTGTAVNREGVEWIKRQLPGLEVMAERSSDQLLEAPSYESE